MKHFLIAVTAIALAVGLAAGPASAQDELTGYTGVVRVQGQLDGSPAATVRAYVSGLLVAEAEAGPTGSYTIEFEVSGAVDQTVVVWFIPSDEDKVPDLLILKESSRARRNQVWNPCLPRAKAQDLVLYDCQFKSEKDYFDALEGNDCWNE